MRPLITKPEKFAKWFNSTVQGAYRQLTVQDARDMTQVGLIGYYGRLDLEIVRKFLRYEQLRQKRIEKEQANAIPNVRTCKLCRNTLPVEPCSKHGRPREYCVSCKSDRVKARHRKWRDNKQKAKQKSLSCTM